MRTTKQKSRKPRSSSSQSSNHPTIHPSNLPLFPLSPDTTHYRRLPGDWVRVIREKDRRVLRIRPAALALLAETAFHDVSFFFRTKHLEQLAAVAADRRTSTNDRFVARCLLENATIAAEGVLPLCQDTGTATVIAHRGHDIVTGVDDAQWLTAGIRDAYRHNNLRHSQLAPLGMFDECNTGDNLPAQIDIQAVPGSEYRFLFVAKGGGSSNKTSLYQESKALLSGDRKLLDFLEEKIRAIGVAACPPYHLAIVIGGTSPELTLKTVKLASAGALDTLTSRPTGKPHAYRDLNWEEKILALSRRLGLGAQFGGRHFALDVRVIRMPRHAGSLPIGIGVSCNAHRNIKARIDSRGVFLEQLDTNPARFLTRPRKSRRISGRAKPESTNDGGIPINLDQPIDRVVEQLNGHAVGARLSLTGPLIVARDIAHIRLKKMLDSGGPLPDYFRKHAVYYAGPARTPKGMPSGSFGPTTAQRMDSYVADFMKHGASRIMLAKGNRSPAVAAACRKYKGFYLGTIGGAAALVARRNILSSEILDFPDLGMEAIRLIRVENLPSFIIGDNKGKTLYG